MCWLQARGCQAAADAAASVAGVGKVLLADNAAYEHQLAENLSQLVAELGVVITAMLLLRPQQPVKT